MESSLGIRVDLLLDNSFIDRWPCGPIPISYSYTCISQESICFIANSKLGCSLVLVHYQEFLRRKAPWTELDKIVWTLRVLASCSIFLIKLDARQLKVNLCKSVAFCWDLVVQVIKSVYNCLVISLHVLLAQFNGYLIDCVLIQT